MWKKTSSLNTKILLSFLIFSVLILGFLWVFQVLFLDSFYQSEKTKDIELVGSYIKTIQNSEQFASLIEEVSFEKEVCIEITNQTDSLFESNFFGKGCIRDQRDKIAYMDQFIRSNLEEQKFEFHNPQFNSKTLLYAVKLDNNRYAFINTSIEPIDATTQIIQKQLVIITIIVLLLSVLISFFISNHLSKPIANISKQAKNMADGDLKTKFDDQSNITELNELSNTLNYARDELAKTDELRRDLMSNVSHDLKTPLTMIKAYAEMGMDLHLNKKEKQIEDMEIIISEVDRLSLLVNDILDLSKMESNISELTIEKFDLISLTNDILKRYKLYQELENYQFNFITSEKKVMISADKKKMEQVIYNLINNAIHYTGDDNLVTIQISKSKKKILVEVIDTGKGIKKEDLPYIWDRYYKNSKKHKRNLVGTGLGLSIVKNILEQHHFQYGVHTKEGEGSTFYFEIQN